MVVIAITDAAGKLNKNNLPAQDSWFLLYSDTSNPDKMIFPNRIIPSKHESYSFLDKDSVVRCEEIRSLSKARLDVSRGCIGELSEKDMDLVKNKFIRAYNL